MEQISLTEARSTLTELVNQVSYKGKHISITKHGKPAAVLVPVEAAEWIEKMEDLIDIREADAAIEEEGSVSHAEFLKELGLYECRVEFGHDEQK